MHNTNKFDTGVGDEWDLISDPASTASARAFRTGAYCVGIIDSFVGVVGLVAVVNSMVASQSRLPMFGQYLNNMEGYGWAPPPEFADYYWERNIVDDPFRLQLLIVGIICAAGGMILGGILLILGCLLNRSWLLGCWLLPNYFVLAAHAILLLAAACYVWWATYALMGAPLLMFRFLLVWVVHVCYRTMPKTGKVKKGRRQNMRDVEAAGSGETSLESNGKRSMGSSPTHRNKSETDIAITDPNIKIQPATTTETEPTVPDSREPLREQLGTTTSPNTTMIQPATNTDPAVPAAAIPAQRGVSLGTRNRARTPNQSLVRPSSPSAEAQSNPRNSWGMEIVPNGSDQVVRAASADVNYYCEPNSSRDVLEINKVEPWKILVEAADVRVEDEMPVQNTEVATVVFENPIIISESTRDQISEDELESIDSQCFLDCEDCEEL